MNDASLKIAELRVVRDISCGVERLLLVFLLFIGVSISLKTELIFVGSVLFG